MHSISGSTSIQTSELFLPVRWPFQSVPNPDFCSTIHPTLICPHQAFSLLPVSEMLCLVSNCSNNCNYPSFTWACQVHNQETRVWSLPWLKTNKQTNKRNHSLLGPNAHVLQWERGWWELCSLWGEKQHKCTLSKAVTCGRRRLCVSSTAWFSGSLQINRYGGVKSRAPGWDSFPLVLTLRPNSVQKRTQ